MNFISRFKNGLPNSILATSITTGAGFFSGLVLARTLGPSLRGEFAAVLLWPGALALFGDLGLGFAFSYHAGKDRRSVGRLCTLAWGISVAWGGMLAIGGSVIVPSIIDFSPAAIRSLKWAMASIPFTMATGYQAFILLGSGSITAYNLVRVFTVSSYVVGIVGAATLGWSGIKSYTVVYLVSQAMSTLLVTGHIFRAFHPSIGWQFDTLRSIMVYGLKTHLSSIAAQANLRLDQLLMTTMVSSEQLGIYVVAVAISNALSPFYNSLAVVVLPRVTETTHPLEGARQVVRHIHVGIIFGIPMAVVALIAIPWILPLLFGGDYEGSVVLAQVLLVAFVFQGMNAVLGNGLRGLGHPGKTALAEGGGLLLTISLLLALLPALGALGAAITSLVAYATVMLAQTTFVRQATGLAWRDFWLFRWRDLLQDISAAGLRPCRAMKRNDLL